VLGINSRRRRAASATLSADDARRARDLLAEDPR
jgi:hypothetical protein